MVRHSQPMKNASTATNTASSPASDFIKSRSNLNNFARSSAKRQISSNARPESQADATKMGAMIAEYHALAICRPKIHAVTLCTRMATGSATRESTATLRSSPRTNHTRSSTLMTR